MHNTLTGKLDKSILKHIQKAEIQHNQYSLPFYIRDCAMFSIGETEIISIIR